jgi:hypothetical protein
MSDENYTTEEIAEALQRNGELLLTLDSDAYSGPVEVHLHDANFDHDNGEVALSLADGRLGFRASSVESIATHKQTAEDLGL